MLTNIFTFTETLGNLKKLSFLLVDFHKVVYDNFLSNKKISKNAKIHTVDAWQHQDDDRN